MSECSELWTRMLLFCCFCLFVVSDAVDVKTETEYQSSVDPSKELLYVVVLFRHGHRTPMGTYPNDPHKNESFYPYGLNQLTNEGKRYMYDMGTFLRERYANFLENQYVPSAVFAQSTDMIRTKLSLQIVLAGLFPPKNTAMEWNHQLNWQPIAIASEALQDASNRDLPHHKPCPRVFEAFREVKNRPEVKRMDEENKELLEELAIHSGSSIKSTTDVFFLYDILRCESEYGLKLPEWTREYYPYRMVNLSALCFTYFAYTDELKQLTAGPFVEKMATEFQRKRNGTLNDLKISLYSAHDLTVVNVLSALNVWETQLPGPGIMTMFELARDKETNKIGVQIYLRTNATNGAEPLEIPNCGHFCPLDKFIEMTRKVIPSDFDALCKSRK